MPRNFWRVVNRYCQHCLRRCAERFKHIHRKIRFNKASQTRCRISCTDYASEDKPDCQSNHCSGRRKGQDSLTQQYKPVPFYHIEQPDNNCINHECGIYGLQFNPLGDRRPQCCKNQQCFRKKRQPESDFCRNCCSCRHLEQSAGNLRHRSTGSKIDYAQYHKCIRVSGRKLLHRLYNQSSVGFSRLVTLGGNKRCHLYGPGT